MKNLLVLLFFAVSISASAQLSAGDPEGPTPAPSGPITAYQMAQMGKSNGCRDGARPLAQAQSAYIDIMGNPAISTVYKEAYEMAWGVCRQNKALGTPISGSGMTNEASCFLFGNCTGSQWITIYIYFTGGSNN